MAFLGGRESENGLLAYSRQQRSKVHDAKHPQALVLVVHSASKAWVQEWKSCAILSGDCGDATGLGGLLGQVLGVGSLGVGEAGVMESRRFVTTIDSNTGQQHWAATLGGDGRQWAAMG